MTKADIAEKLQREHGITKVQAVELVEHVLDLVKDALVQGEKSKLQASESSS